MTFWTVEISEEEDEPNLVDVEIEDTYNPFGNFAIAHIKDQDGGRYDKYAKGTRVDFYYSSGILASRPEDLILTETTDESTTLAGETTYASNVYNEGTVYVEGDLVTAGYTRTRRFTGFVVERREYEQQGTDMLEVECYSFDQFLRGSKVTTNTNGMTLFDALESIISNDTPITWNAANVSVGDPQTLTRNLRGESVETALRELAYKSENEEFGVQQDLEFYFRPRETSQSPRDIDNSQVFGIDTPEEGREELYEVRVWFNGGDESVTVDRGDEKLDQQEALGLDTPPENVKEVTFEDITDIDDARDKGEQILQDREASQTGEVQTYGLEDTEPGDLITITYDAQDVDQEYVVAGINYQWQEDTTTVTIIKKTGYQDEVLLRIADNVEKVDLRPADRDAINNRVTETTIAAEIAVSGNADGNAYTEYRYTNTARNLARDAWTGSGNLDITEIAVGGDNSNLSRSNQSLENELTRVAATETLPDSKSVQYEASITQTGVSEVGLFDSSGNLITRAILDSAVDINGTVSVTLTVSNDDNINRGVITNAGQTSVRDTIADNSPNLPTQYAYGDGQTDPLETDTSLENQLIAKSLDDLLIASADNQTTFESLVGEVPETTPAAITEDGLEASRTNLLVSARDSQQVTSFGDQGTEQGNEYTSSSGLLFSTESDDPMISNLRITNHTIPEANVDIAVRWAALSDSIPVDISIVDDETDNTIGTITADPQGTTFSVLWDFASKVAVISSWDDGDIPPGNYRIEAEAAGTSTGDGTVIDVISIFDDRYHDADTSDNGGEFSSDLHESGGELNGPGLYPDLAEVTFAETTTRRNVTAARIASTWDDTTNNQYLQVSNNGTDFLPDDGTQNNTDSVDVTFASGETGVIPKVGLSRYPVSTNPRDTSPRFLYNGQAVTQLDLFANPDAITSDGIGAANTRAIVNPGELTGETLREAGALASDDSLLTRSVYAAFDVTSQMRLISSETQTWDNP